MAMAHEEAEKSYKNDERPAGIPLDEGDAPEIHIDRTDFYETLVHLLRVYPEQWSSLKGELKHMPTGIELHYSMAGVKLMGEAEGLLKLKWRHQRELGDIIKKMLAASWHKAAMKSSLGKKTRYESIGPYPGMADALAYAQAGGIKSPFPPQPNSIGYPGAIWGGGMVDKYTAQAGQAMRTAVDRQMVDNMRLTTTPNFKVTTDTSGNIKAGT